MERYFFIEPWENLQDGEHQAILNFALKKSTELNTKLSICVHSKIHCDQFLQKCFSNDAFNKKLINGQKIILQGVTVQIESMITLRRQFIMESMVYLALFPSKDLMTVLENQNTKAAAIIVFSETQHSEHLIEWKKKFKPQILEYQTIDIQNS